MSDPPPTSDPSITTATTPTPTQSQPQSPVVKKQIEADPFKRMDREPTCFGSLKMEIPNKKTGLECIPKFMVDDGSWEVNRADSLPMRISNLIRGALQLLNNIVVLMLTCGASNQKLFSGFAKQPLFTRKYGRNGPGRYKHIMKVNKSDFHQRNLTELAKQNPNRRVSSLPERRPSNYHMVGSPGASNKVIPAIEPSSTSASAGASAISPAGPKTCMKKPSDGLGTTEKPKKTLEIWREVRIVVFSNAEDQRRKSALWVTSDMILKNKKEHKKEKQKLELQRKKAAADRQLAKIRENEKAAGGGAKAGAGAPENAAGAAGAGAAAAPAVNKEE